MRFGAAVAATTTTAGRPFGLVRDPLAASSGSRTVNEAPCPRPVAFRSYRAVVQADKALDDGQAEPESAL